MNYHEMIKQHNPVGARVRLIRTPDEWTALKAGEEGTIRHVDDMGTVHIDWDCGAKLGLISNSGDRWEVLA